MIRTLDFNAFAAGTVIDDEYLASDGVTVSAVAGGNGVDQAMLFDSNNPTGDDTDLASDTLDGLLIISEDGDSSDPDDNDGGGSIFFDFDDLVRIKSLTFKDIEETTGEGTRMIFYDANGDVIDNQFVEPTEDGGERTVGIFVQGVSRMEVRLEGSGAIDNLVFDDGKMEDTGPTAVDDMAETDEDTSVIIDLRGNDTDPNNSNDELTIGGFVSPNGTVEDLGDGTVRFTPAENFNGEATFTYTVTDPNFNSDTGEVTIQVNPVNDAPVANDDSDTTEEETPVEINLLANDTDVDGDALTVTTATVPAAEGTLEPVNDGTDGLYTFTPAAGFIGTATVSYAITDGNGGTASAVHTIDVADDGVNGNPVANPDALTTDEDTPSAPLNVLSNDSDPDGDTLTLTSATSTDGEVSFTPEGEVVFTPNPDFNGPTTITYTVSDGNGGEATGTVDVTVNPVNDAPVANDDVDVTPEDEPITVDLLANDTDVDGDELTVTEVSVPAEQGTIVNNNDGTATFTPAPDFNGQVTISYTISDPDGLTDSAEHTVYVNAVSDGPVALDDVAETPEDTAVTIDVLANDTDPDGDETLFISRASVPEDQGTVEIVDNQLVFTPAPDFNGPVTISYTAEDPDGNEAPAEVAVNVTPVNDAPVAEDDSDVTELNTPIRVDLLANDSDVDGDELTVTEATVPAEQGTLSGPVDGTILFTPAAGFTGEATISYTIADAEGLTDSAVHTIVVNQEGGAPTANPDTAETPEDTPVTIDVLENDTDPQGQPLTITEASVPEEQGTVEIVDNELLFTPAPDFSGPCMISYTVQDPDGNAGEGTVSVNVTPVNDAPDAVNDEDTTAFNTPVTVDLLANDTDPEGDPLTVTSATVPAEQGTVSAPVDGTVVFTPAPGFEGEAVISYSISDGEGGTDSAVHVITVGDNSAPVAVDDEATTPEDTPVTIDLIGNDEDENGDPLTLVEATVPEEQGTLVDNGDGTVTFTPAPDFNGPATISYTVTDPYGATDGGEATVDVLPVNDAPVAEDDTDVTDFNTAVTVDLLANDFDVDGDDLLVTSVTVPAEQGTVVDNGDGTATFTPADGFTGEATLSYSIRDVEGLTDSAEHVIIVNSEGDMAPTANPDTAETPEDTPVTIDVLDNDTDPQDDPLTIREASVPEEQGTVEIVDNELVFTPAEDFNGPVDITYIVEDPDGNADEGTVRVDVTPVNDAPIAVDDVATTEEDTPVVLDLVDNDSDPDGDPLTVTAVSVPEEQGTVVNNGDGTATFTPAQDFVGEATVTYTIQDPDGAEDTAVHVVDVTPINDAPVAMDDADVTDEDTPITVDLLANDTDVDGDDLRVTEATVPEEQGTLVDNGDGTVTFTPAPNFNGTATISYTISDGNGGEDSAVHVIEVDPEIEPPVANDDEATTAEDTPVVIDLRGNDSDPDNTLDELTISDLTVDPEQGTVVDNGDGTVTFTPAPDFNGEATITYTLTDPDGASDDAVATVTVTPVNDAPVAVDDVEGTPYNTPAENIPVLANDTDVDEDPLRVVEATSPNGDVVINPDGTLTFTPTDGFTGPAEITYTISDRPAGDPEGLTDEGTLIVNVAEPGERDGIVDGTDGDDLIDTDYAGDPDGDFVDNEDAIIPGQAPNDDIIRAGDGNDTVEAGLGDDSVTGGAGDDSILGEDGSDTVDGGDGDDVIDTGNGDLAPDQGYPDAPTDSLGFEGDADPENDRDSVNGGDGNDTIRTGDDRDTISGGNGNDVIDGGIDDDIIDGDDGDDRIVGGEGNDTINGGDGNDTIYAGNDPDGVGDLLDIEDELTPGSPFSPDRNPDNGRDVVNGGAGDDLIFGADDRDSLVGGSGNDTIDGEIDDDTIQGGSGDDSLLGGQGNDTIDGGTGDDFLDGGVGDDTLRGNRNDDTIFGGDGDDVLDGGGEDDLLDGGDGDDNLQGGQGDDTLRGGDGDDTMTGGAGQDVFEDVGPGDDIDGGSGPVDFDTLDLRGSAPEGGRLEVTYTSPDREDGFVNYFDEDGNDAGQLVFEEIENVIPCFTPGTKIATPKGERLVETLKVGDRVITRDNGIQEIRWVGARDMSGAELEKASHLKPVLIRQGALGNDLPERDMMVSPNHRVLVANDKTALYFEEREVLVAAKHLTGLEGVDIVDVSHTTYIHVMFDQHEVILSDGSWTESFQPGDMSLAGIGNAQRQEILELFPELATQEGIDNYASARRSLKKHEAKLITK
ncbi:Ig-like domain-containing protein [Sulfitobacter sp. F26204]|uniref:cadherin-like domain-containing protein n=1 Tax=Sulfitobacter sp. F26204 TaxID=2996014 RepID=UPI00225E5975|nr:cadherin-like domain-containing protein [Sulfitobacter sp. F26204]MCX7559949.1 Ig-like domain-containing protein [Sulfitobacter sp. F26204]